MSSEDGEDESFYDAEDDIESGRADQHRRMAESAWSTGMASADAIGQPSAWRESAIVASDEDASRARSRSRSSAAPGKATESRSSSTRSHYRYSLPPAPLEPVPLIPAKFLEAGRPSFVQRRSDDSRPANLYIQHPATAGKDAPSPRSPRQRAAYRGDEEEVAPVQPHAPVSDAQERPSSRFARRKSLPPSTPQLHKSTLDKLENAQTQDKMSRLGQRRNEDLFLELANDGEQDVRPPSRGGERALSRLSRAGTRRSMPGDHTLPSSAERRPKSSGQAFANRPTSRLDVMSSNMRQADRYRSTPSRASYRPDDTASLSGRSQPSLPQRWTSMAERSPASPSLRERIGSPESMQYGRRRRSFGTTPLQPQKTRQSRLPGSFDEHSESPAEGSEPKHSQDSASVDSAADTVWDELDELKSRIKKLELTGKLPPTSGAAMSSNESSERPRTATTAPTTIDSSPKREKQDKKADSVATPAEATSGEYAVGGPSVANIHPLLHSALAKAKPLLNSNLYRTLEATASDALQLAAMTGGSGPQGTAFSAVSMINGASDRHVRRKADTMCRNLTDLCLALCEGKLEAGSVAASPVTINTPVRDSPSVRHARSSLGPPEGDLRATSRPMSRLEARRTSILGTGSSFGASPSPNRESEDVSASDAEHTPSHVPSQEPRRLGRAGSRLQVQRPQYEDVSGDEDPTIRPVSRAMTDNFRSRPSGPRDYSSAGAQRSPSLRDSLVTRRANVAAYEDNHRLTRVTSLNSESGRRRYLDHQSTPPVLEEESTGPPEVYQPTSGSKRRVTSYGFGNRRATADLPNRTTSLNQRRHVVVE